VRSITHAQASFGGGGRVAIGEGAIGATLRYMHLSPAARQGAIELLNDRRPIFGDIVETAAGGAKIQPFSREITG
jgi:hypothetical protein